MDQLIKVIVLAVLQGVTELFPVSSLGHTIIIPSLLGWGDVVGQDTFLPIVVILHLGTAVALLVFYWRDWLGLIRAFFKTIFARRLDADPLGKTIWLVIVATIPVGLLGLIFEKKIDEWFFTAKYPVLPAAFLCLNGAVLLSAELLRKRSEEDEGAGLPAAKRQEAFKSINDLTFLQALGIGFLQAAALLPGISRSGITMVGCLRVKMRREDAAHFTFLLLTPVIVAAALKELPKLIHAGSHMLIIAGIGGVVAAIAAFLSIRFLTRYFQVGRLTPFAIYCLIAGFAAFAFFAAQIMIGS